ncbi:MAG TPA: TonB-dependent receptor [Bacteroidales bacterium]|nr:TonB-dependent receptor [Bacteroidales bacterium]HNS46295.1 TonB-dependent receptor [Bacteroidales bacterium]
MKPISILYHIILILAFPIFCGAQEGRIIGYVTGKDGGSPLAGAHVVLLPDHRVTSTDFSGYFKFTGLPAGKYQTTVSFIGFSTVTLDVILAENQITTLNVQLFKSMTSMDEAVITGSRILDSKNNNPLTITVISRDELDRSGESNVLPVLSNRIPGVFVTERGITGFGVGQGSAGGISVRGVGGQPNTRVLVMIDGHPQFAGIFGHPLPDAYITSDIEKAEVVRGPVSLLYGSNAMAGAINLITRQQEQDGLSISGRAQYGSFHTQKYMTSVGFKKNKFNVTASFNHDQTDGHRDNSNFRISNGYIKSSLEINPRFRLIISGSMAGYRSTDPGPVNSADTSYQNGGHWSDFIRGECSVTLENHFQKSEGALKLYYNGGEHKLYDGFHSTDHLQGINLFQGIKLWPDNLITVGADLKSYGGFAENILPLVPVNFADTVILESAAYLMVQNALSEKLVATAGVRLEVHESFGSEWIPQFGVTYHPTQFTVLKGIISKGFRSPTLQELFLFNSANPNLKPERMWNYEVSAGQFFHNGRIYLESNLFFMKGNNLIQTTGVFPDIVNVNSGKFTHYGAELTGKYHLSDEIQFIASYAWLHTDQPVVAAPQHQLFIEGDYQWKKLNANLKMAYVNNLITKTNPEVIRQNYLLLDAALHYRLLSFLTVFVRGQNLLDQRYEINFGYSMPGITATAGINIRLQLYEQ